MMAYVQFCPPIPIGPHYSNSSLSSAVALSKISNSRYLIVQALTQNVRFTLDGTTPTASLGFRLTAGDPPTIIDMERIGQIKFIEETASASIQYQWGA